MPLVESFLLKRNQKKGETDEFHIAFPTTAFETSDMVNNPAEEEQRRARLDRWGCFLPNVGRISVGGVVMESLLEQTYKLR